MTNPALKHTDHTNSVHTASLAIALALAGCASAPTQGSDEPADDDDETAIAESNLSFTQAGFTEGFEAGNLASLSCQGNCPRVTTASPFEGRFAASFALDRTMVTPYRTEATIAGGPTFAFDQEYWIDMHYAYDDWAPDPRPEIAPFQIHTRPHNWDKACSVGSAVSTAPFLMVSAGNMVQFVTYGNKQLWQVPIELKKWQHLTVHFKISKGPNGFVETWKDGVKLGKRVTGPNSPATDGCGEPLLTPYFKMGIYKWVWKAGQPPTGSTVRKLRIDALSIRQN